MFTNIIFPLTLITIKWTIFHSSSYFVKTEENKNGNIEMVTMNYIKVKYRRKSHSEGLTNRRLLNLMNVIKHIPSNPQESLNFYIILFTLFCTNSVLLIWSLDSNFKLCLETKFNIVDTSYWSEQKTWFWKNLNVK